MRVAGKKQFSSCSTSTWRTSDQDACTTSAFTNSASSIASVALLPTLLPIITLKSSLIILSVVLVSIIIIIL